MIITTVITIVTAKPQIQTHARALRELFIFIFNDIIIIVTVNPQILTPALEEFRWQGDLRFQNNDLYDL